MTVYAIKLVSGEELVGEVVCKQQKTGNVDWVSSHSCHI